MKKYILIFILITISESLIAVSLPSMKGVADEMAPSSVGLVDVLKWVIWACVAVGLVLTVWAFSFNSPDSKKYAFGTLAAIFVSAVFNLIFI